MRRLLISLSLLSLTWQVATSSDRGVLNITYLGEEPLEMLMGESKNVSLRLSLDKDYLSSREFENLTVHFRTATLLPQFSILSFNGSTSEVSSSRKELIDQGFRLRTNLTLSAGYIGHALLQPYSVAYSNRSGTTRIPVDLAEANSLDVIITQDEGISGTIFVVSVSMLMVVIFVNLGGQIDLDNARRLLSQPKPIVIGSIIVVVAMPIVSWSVFYLLLPDQLLHRIGSLVFACGPVALAATPWTELLGGDRELSMGLQLVSMIGALFTMPAQLHFMAHALKDHELMRKNLIKVPYGRLINLSISLLICLALGYKFIGLNPKLKKITAKIYKPLMFGILISIIISSSMIYWHIYRMFDWTITAASALVILVTLFISSVSGYAIGRNKRHALVIGISSIYKNEGIAFTVLLVTFRRPDNYIAYVPCLTQIILTSLSCTLVKLAIRLYSGSDKSSDGAQTAGTGKLEEKAPAKGLDGATRDTKEDLKFISLDLTSETKVNPTTPETPVQTIEGNVQE